MTHINFEEFRDLIDSAINSGKGSLSFQSFGYDNFWVEEMVERLTLEQPFYGKFIESVYGAEVRFFD